MNATKTTFDSIAQKAKPMPPCGVRDCEQPSFWVDACGVGFCIVHDEASLTWPDIRAAECWDDFDAWWAAMGVNPEAFEDLEYGEWP